LSKILKKICPFEVVFDAYIMMNEKICMLKDNEKEAFNNIITIAGVQSWKVR